MKSIYASIVQWMFFHSVTRLFPVVSTWNKLTPDGELRCVHLAASLEDLDQSCREYLQEQDQKAEKERV